MQNSGQTWSKSVNIGQRSQTWSKLLIETEETLVTQKIVKGQIWISNRVSVMQSRMRKV
jgi:hypothetical protein